MEWFFGGWEGVARVIVMAVLAYLAYTFILRVSGKRTLSKMNTFDLILAIALGSLLGRTILAKDVALIESLVALVTLITMQVIFTWSSTKSRRVRDIVHPRPTLLYYDGQYLSGDMRKERVATEDIREAARNEGYSSLDEVIAVVLEGDGDFSVIKRSESGDERMLGTMVGRHRRQMDVEEER